MDSETELSASAVVLADCTGEPPDKREILTPDFALSKDNVNETEQLDGGVPDPPNSILKNTSSSSVAVGDEFEIEDGGKKKGKR